MGIEEGNSADKNPAHYASLPTPPPASAVRKQVEKAKGGHPDNDREAISLRIVEEELLLKNGWFLDWYFTRKHSSLDAKGVDLVVTLSSIIKDLLNNAVDVLHIQIKSSSQSAHKFTARRIVNGKKGKNKISVITDKAPPLMILVSNPEEAHTIVGQFFYQLMGLIAVYTSLENPRQILERIEDRLQPDSAFIPQVDSSTFNLIVSWWMIMLDQTNIELFLESKEGSSHNKRKKRKKNKGRQLNPNGRRRGRRI